MIFVNSFMTILTHMQFQGPELFTPGAVEFPLASLVLIFRCLLDPRQCESVGINSDRRGAWGMVAYGGGNE